MSLLEHLENGEQRYEAVPAALSKVELPLDFSTRSGRCAIVGRDPRSPSACRHLSTIDAR